MKSHQHSNPLRAYSGRQLSRAQLMRRPGCTKESASEPCTREQSREYQAGDR